MADIWKEPVAARERLRASTAKSVLNPRELDRRLEEIELVARSSYDTDQEAFDALQSMVFRLRKDIAQEAAWAPW